MAIGGLLALIVWGMVGTAVAQEPAVKPSVTEHVDYAMPLSQLYDLMLDPDLTADRARYAAPLELYMKRCAERGKTSEADVKLAGRAYGLARSLQGVLEAWSKRQANLERIRTDKGVMFSNSPREQQIQKDRMERQLKNEGNLWAIDVRDFRASLDSDLAVVKDWQAKLDRAIEAGVVVVKGGAAVAVAPAPAPGAPEEPAPSEPAARPPPVNYTFTQPKSQVKMSDNLKTPDRLIPVVKKTANWLEVQHRKAGGKLAARLYANDEAGVTTLYLQMTPVFSQLDHKIRLELAQGIWQFWAMSCVSEGVVRSKAAAHLVLTNESDAVIGQSSDTDGSVISVAN